MGEGQGRQLASKWAKTTALLAHPRIAPHIPPTKRYTNESLRSMLEAYDMVVIKPVVGGGGHGVIKISKQNGGYTSTYFSDRRVFASFEDLVRALVPLKRGRKYIIQKGIHLASISGRPIDYRVKYVKEGKGWVYRAMVGRLARRGLFVTNLCRGGLQMAAAEGIRRSLSASLVRSKKKEMRELTQVSTKVLEGSFPGIGQLGFDYGIDTKGKIWVFEVNTRPQ